MNGFTFYEYEQNAAKTLQIAKTELIPYYLGLGLTGEAGEVAEKLKKVIRNENGDLSKLNKDDFRKELGDVLWYLTMLARMSGTSLEEVAKANNEKLLDRLNRDVIKSTGDNR